MESQHGMGRSHDFRNPNRAIRCFCKITRVLCRLDGIDELLLSGGEVDNSVFRQNPERTRPVEVDPFRLFAWEVPFPGYILPSFILEAHQTFRCTRDQAAIFALHQLNCGWETLPL
jgi:hypothetical protein